MSTLKLNKPAAPRQTKNRVRTRTGQTLHTRKPTEKTPHPNAPTGPAELTPAPRKRPAAKRHDANAAGTRTRAAGSDARKPASAKPSGARPARPASAKPGGARPTRPASAKTDARPARPASTKTDARPARTAKASAPPPRVAPAQPTVQHPPGSVRLSKRMSELGLTSRREADEWIERGWVRVDGKTVSELGVRVLPDQKIEIDNRAEKAQAELVTILLNKPVGFVSGQAEKGYKPAITLLTPDNRWEEDKARIEFKREHLRGLAPAGRLDIDSVGLLVFTQDGRLAKRLIGERSEIEKEYLVRVKYTGRGQLPEADLARLNHGLELDGVALRPAKVSWQNEDQLRFVLREGRKRQIRRMCEAVGLEVLALKRIRIGSLSLSKLPPGQWRYLGAHEKF